jgi:hypothetical protein
LHPSPVCNEYGAPIAPPLRSSLAREAASLGSESSNPPNPASQCGPSYAISWCVRTADIPRENCPLDHVAITVLPVIQELEVRDDVLERHGSYSSSATGDTTSAAPASAQVPISLSPGVGEKYFSYSPGSYHAIRKNIDSHDLS